MLNKQDTSEALNAFVRYVVQQSRSNLTRQGRNVSKELYNSIGGDVSVSKNSFELSFRMEKYGQFQDKGVKGAGGTKADGTKWKTKTVINSPFSYKDKMPPTKSFDKWIVKRGFAPRNEKGKFTSRESMKYAIAKSVYHTGIATSNFFSRPFDLAYERLPDDVVEAYGLDIDSFLKTALKL